MDVIIFAIRLNDRCESVRMSKCHRLASNRFVQLSIDAIAAAAAAASASTCSQCR